MATKAHERRHMFEPHSNEGLSHRERRAYAAFEIAYTLVDFGAALCFVVGSVLFFWEATMVAGTWAFLVGSVLFAAKPSIRLARELRKLGHGRTSEVARKAAD
ncbi:YrhK family protein [Acuticoccus yangtzensis]|uniref:YrhK family protein n=1 Tax=Acuticoccus yangtzensis TaxID=1443441 RepID=UPI0009F7D3D1|nr:YrhK family protein [Acuticoccus yangtzensis]ORE93430.1 hypothetical protein ATO13_12171 [Stappia sp. 22II-S9-Z10]